VAALNSWSQTIPEKGLAWGWRLQSYDQRAPSQAHRCLVHPSLGYWELLQVYRRVKQPEYKGFAGVFPEHAQSKQGLEVVACFLVQSVGRL
jgi:hypothetical protein